MLFNSSNVIYLEQSEFDSNFRLNSSLPNKYTNQPLFSGLTIVMIQGNYCGYCTQMKPIYQQVADEMSQQGIDFATIQIDGSQPGEQIFTSPDFLQQVMQKPLEGVPMIVKFYQGQYVPNSEYTGPREVESLKSWVVS